MRQKDHARNLNLELLPNRIEILTILFHFSRPKSFTEGGPENRFSLDIKQFLSFHQLISNQPFNLYPGGYPMENNLKLYMPCS